METVREFIGRLAEAVASEENIMGVRHQRRLVVSEATKFALDGTILRTTPIGTPFKRPGSSPEMPQVLEWVDTPSDENLRDNDLGVDLAAILGLATKRKVAFMNEIPVVQEGATWTWFAEVGPQVDGGLYGPVDDDIRSRLVTIIKALVALPEKKALALGGGIRMRNIACSLLEVDHSSAYGLLVAALEVLSRAFGTPPHSWANWDQAGTWDTFIAELGLSTEDAQKLRQKLLVDKHLRLKQTFVEYAVENVSSTLWEQQYFSFSPGVKMDVNGVTPQEGIWRDMGPVTNLVPTDLAELRERLKKSYDARSGVFHQSLRLDRIQLMPFPASSSQEPLTFAGLRLLLDHLLWLEAEKGANDAPELPDIQIYHS